MAQSANREPNIRHSTVRYSYSILCGALVDGSLVVSAQMSTRGRQQISARAHSYKNLTDELIAIKWFLIYMYFAYFLYSAIKKPTGDSPSSYDEARGITFLV